MKCDRLWALMLFACVAAPGLSEDEDKAAPKPAERRYPFETITLDNRLKVISLEDFSCPLVAVQVWYHVGSKDEDPERQGFAHMFEHMMFRGTDRLGPTSHFDNIHRVGGDNNAYTAFDQTVYIQEVPSSQLELVMWLESERMAFLKIDQEGFDKERKVVEEERRMGLNRPYGKVPEKALAEIYKAHPYRWMPIGKIPHLRAATIDELQKFWDTFYVPNNATLVVVGAAKHKDVQQMARRYFGWIPKCPAPPRVTVKEPPQKKPMMVKLTENKGPLPVIGLMYRGVPEGHKDGAALEVLMGVLGGGESSRLYVDAVKEQKIAQVAMAAAIGLEQDGLLAAGGILLPMGDKKGLAKTMQKHIDSLRKEPITQAELDKMKNQLLRQEVDGALTVASKAGLLGKYDLIYGDAEFINRRLQEIESVTIEDVSRVAKQYFDKSQRISVLIEPSASGMIGSLFGKDKKSDDPEEEGFEEENVETKAKENRVATRTGAKAEAKRPADFPEKPPLAPVSDDFPEVRHVSKKLPNGLEVIVISNHEVPMVTMMMGIKSGAWTEKKPGTANAAMSLLTKATKTRKALDLAELLESRAIELSGSASMDTSSVSASALKSQLDLAAELMADVVMNPAFPQDEFDILKQQLAMGLMISTKTPEYVADQEFRKRLFGGHPYARTATGEAEDVEALRLDDLKNWWSVHIRPDNAVLYIAGDVDDAAAFKLAEKNWAGWKVETEFDTPKIAEPPVAGSMHIYLVDRPGSVQSQIRVGHVSITRQHKLYPAARVLSTILGGGFNSRLNKAIRVDKGLTYGARGGISPQRFGGQFQISTFTKNVTTGETVQTILREIAKLQEAEPTAEELDDTKSYIIGGFPGDRETPQATVGDLWMIETEGLPDEYLRAYLRGVKGTQASDVEKAAKGLIDSERLVIVVVGQASQIEEQLRKIGPVTVIGRRGEEKSEGAQEAGKAEQAKPAAD